MTVHSRVIVAALVVSLADPVLAQQPLPPLPVPSTTGTLPPTPPASTREWSGESGSSGHPLMTADAIRAAAANFGACLEGLWPQAQRARRFAGNLRHAHARPHARSADHGPDGRAAGIHQVVLGLSRYPGQRGTDPERTRDSCQASRDLRRGGKGLWRRPPLHRVDLGRRVELLHAIGERSVLRSTATLACVGRRQDYFRDEFLAALEILHRGDVRPEHLKGSWAGAFGPTQFMPTSSSAIAVDFDGDGRRDVVGIVRGPDRLHRQQSQEGRLGRRPDLGLRGHRAARLQLPARRPLPP